jgi:hypothetical protein
MTRQTRKRIEVALALLALLVFVTAALSLVWWLNDMAAAIG